MKMILFLILLLSTTYSKSQIADLPTHNIVKDSLIAKLNRNDYKSVYSMADSSFKAGFSENDMVNFLENIKSLGKISSTTLLNDGKDSKEYRLFFAKKSLQLTLGVQNSKTFQSFGLGFFKLPIVNTRIKFASDNPLKTPLDSVVQKAVTAYMSNKNVSGISIGVLKDGKMYSYNFGEVKKGSEQLADRNTIYEIGSITKTFTGILLANAVIEGKVKLNDDIRKYLDGDYPNLEFGGQPIQLVNLSNHTSRLPSEPNIYNTQTNPFDPSVDFKAKMLTDILHHISLDTIPGTKEEYSNFAVGLLGNILEKVYGMTYEQILRKYIFEPYKMSKSKIGFPKAAFKYYAQGYDVEGLTTSYWRNKLAEPAGGIRSTAYDMLLYMKEQLSAKNTAASLSHQLTFGTKQNGKGLSWGIGTTKTGNHIRWSHEGGTDGFTSLCLIYPELNAGVILLTNNGDHDDGSFYEIGKTIYNSWLH